MGNLAIRKKVSILLILSVFFAVFLGGYHHCCECYSQTCTTCQQANHQPFLLTSVTACDDIQTLAVASYVILPTIIFPNPALFYPPLNGRAPPQFVT
jgi:hypothetical protein